MSKDYLYTRTGDAIAAATIVNDMEQYCCDCVDIVLTSLAIDEIAERLGENFAHICHQISASNLKGKMYQSEDIFRDDLFNIGINPGSIPQNKDFIDPSRPTPDRIGELAETAIDILLQAIAVCLDRRLRVVIMPMREGQELELTNSGVVALKKIEHMPKEIIVELTKLIGQKFESVEAFIQTVEILPIFNNNQYARELKIIKARAEFILFKAYRPRSM